MFQLKYYILSIIVISVFSCSSGETDSGDSDFLQIPFINDALDKPIVIEADSLQNTDSTSAIDFLEATITDTVTKKIRAPKKLVDTLTLVEIDEDIDICDTFNLEAKVVVSHILADGEYGKIEIRIIEKDTLTYSINGKTYQDSAIFDSLTVGKYTPMFKNKDGCIEKLPKTPIIKSNCYKNYTRSFSPSKNESWEIPIVEDEEFKVRVFNSSFKTMYTNTHKTGKPSVWDGETDDGKIAPPGLYKAIITYDEGKQCVVSVTLLK